MECQDKILHDLLDVHDWPETTDVLLAEEASTLWRVLAALRKSCVYYLQYPVRLLTGKIFVVHHSLIQLLSAKLLWQLALSNDGTHLAVVQDKCVEIRPLHGDFQTVTAAFQIEADPKPQLRKTVWSEDNAFLAIGSSTGTVSVISLFDTSVRCLPPTTDTTDLGGLEYAVAGLCFIPLKQRHSSDSVDELLLAVLEYGGTLSTYQLRSNEEPLLLHSFSFRAYYPSGVGSMIYHPGLRLLIVGSCHDAGGDIASVSGWRLLNSAPHWTPMLGQQIEKKHKSVISHFFMPTKSSKPKNALVVHMSMSPDGMLLATCDASGHVSVWDLPSFRIRNTFSAAEVPTLSEGNKSMISSIGLLDMNWWSNEALTLVDTSGHLSVLRFDGLEILLDKALDSGSAVTAAHSGQFLILQCHSHANPVASRYRVPSLSEDSEQDDEDHKTSLAESTKLLVKQVLYFITDSERFRPPTKKTKMVTTKYHLSCLRSIPPEEYYARKMRARDYDAALLVAQQYGLDCDLVYQAQWHSSPVSEDAISKYLSKISKPRWILHECLSRVPTNFEAAKQLLSHGLKRITAQDLLSISAQSGAELRPNSEEHFAMLRSLSPEQQTMCEFRMLLLKYLDRLKTYEMIVSHPECSLEFYDAEFYKVFRNGNLLQYAVLFARASDSKALEFLFTYHGEDLLTHRLPILSNFPETTSPHHYKALLPSVSNGEVECWNCQTPREADWVESAAVQKICVLSDHPDSSHTAVLYEQQPGLENFVNPDPDSAAEWFADRASEIEELSGQVGNALVLLEHGIANGFLGLEILRHYLLTLSDLVYECNADSTLTLTRLQATSNVNIIKLMMKEYMETEFIPHLYQCVVPFIQRVVALQSGGNVLLEEYVLSVAQGDLNLVLALCQHEAQLDASSHSAFSSQEEIVQLAVKAIYACKKSKQTGTAELILSSLASFSYSQELMKSVEMLQRHIRACVVLEGHEVAKPICFIQQVQSDPDQTEKLIVQVTRAACRREPKLSEDEWASLLLDILQLRSTVLTSIEEQDCYKIFVESLLCSGCLNYIEFAGQFLARSSSETAVTALKLSEGCSYRIPYEQSVALVLQATQEYFNSASSLMDSDMDLARKCVDLFSSPPAILQDELNLIASLAILDDFQVKMLPVQIRLTPNKLDIIQNILKTSPNAYKQCDKLFMLARYLNVGESKTEVKEADSEEADSDLMSPSMPTSQGYTTVEIVCAAIEKQDFSFADSFCTELMDAQFAPAWKVCRELAHHKAHKNWELKISLLSFAVVHCPPVEIQLLIEELQQTEVQILFMSQSGMSTEYEDPQTRAEYGVAASFPLGVATVQRMMYKSTGAMQQLIGHTSDINPFADCKSREEVLSLCTEGLSISYSSRPPLDRKPSVHLSCHPLYKSAGCYSTYEPKFHSTSQGHALLRALSIAASSAADHDTMKVLGHLAAASDSHLFVGYLLAIAESQALDEALCGLRPTVLSLQLDLYILCLQLCVQTADVCSVPQWPYRQPPSLLLKNVTDCVTSSNLSDWPEQSHALVQLILTYCKLFISHLQSKLLLGIGLGIDVQQFSQDSEYRRSILLGLGRSRKPELFKTACSLAQRHDIPEWEVYVSLLDSLLTDSSLDLKQVSSKLNEFKVVDCLIKNPQEVANYLVSNTYKGIYGINYDMLLLYYTVLQQLQTAGASLKEMVDVGTHLKLLKRFKVIMPDTDYKVLMSGHEPLAVLVPVLVKSNVHQIAKLAHSIPDKSGTTTLTMQSVYCAFSTKLFWSGDEKHLSAHSSAEWLHRYEGCHEYLMQLNPKHLMDFFSDIALSHNAYVKLGLDTRCSLLKRFLKFTLQRMKSEQLHEGENTADARDMTFSDVKQQLEHAVKHLRNLSDASFQLPPSVDEGFWESQMELLDLSFSDPSKVYTISGNLLRVGTPIATLQSILSLAGVVHSHSCSVTELVKSELQSCIQSLSLDQAKGISEIEHILSSVSSHESEGGKFICSADVIETLRGFCCDESSVGSARKAVLQLMETYLQLSAEEYDLLLLNKTLSILENNFKDVEILTSNISTSEAQRHLFCSLLMKAESRSQFLILFALLKAWPQSSTILQDCWLKLLMAVADRPAWCSSVVLIRTGIADIPVDEDKKLFTLLQQNNVLEALKLAFVSSSPKLIERALLIIVEKSSAVQFDQDLLELIILKKQVTTVFRSRLYQTVCDHLQNPPSEVSINHTLFANILKCEETEVEEQLLIYSPYEKVKYVSKLLYATGLIVEASSLLLMAQHFHPCMISFNTALAYIEH